MLRNIHLHGSIGEKFEPVYRLDVETVGEILRAFAVLVPELLAEIREGSWHVIRGDIDSGFSIDLDDVNTFRIGNADIHFVPAVAGSKNSGVLKIILGVALVGVAIFASGGLAGLGGAVSIGGTSLGLTYGNIAMFGFALVLAGASSLLSNVEGKKNDDSNNSFTMSGPSNNYEQGYPVPLIYGEVITGGYTVSAGIDIEDIGS